jgi:hypothetical protein
VEEVCGKSIPQLEQGSKRPWGVKVCSPTVFSVSGLTFLDSPPGGAGGWGAGAGAAGQERTLAFPNVLHSIGRDHGFCPDHLSVHFLLFGKIPCNHWCCGSLPLRHIILSNRRDQFGILHLFTLQFGRGRDILRHFRLLSPRSPGWIAGCARQEPPPKAARSFPQPLAVVPAGRGPLPRTPWP